MTTKEYSELMRQLGFCEGLALGVEGATGLLLTDALCALGEMLGELERIPKEDTP